MCMPASGSVKDVKDEGGYMKSTLVKVKGMEGLSQLAEEVAACVGRGAGSNLLFYHLQRLMPTHRPDFISVSVLVPGRGKMVVVSNLAVPGQGAELCLVPCRQSAAGRALSSGMLSVEIQTARKGWGDLKQAHRKHGVEVFAACRVPPSAIEDGSTAVLAFGWKGTTLPSPSVMAIMEALGSELAGRLAQHTAELLDDVLSFFLPGPKQVSTWQQEPSEDLNSNPSQGPDDEEPPTSWVPTGSPNETLPAARNPSPVPVETLHAGIGLRASCNPMLAEGALPPVSTASSTMEAGGSSRAPTGKQLRGMVADDKDGSHDQGSWSDDKLMRKVSAQGEGSGGSCAEAAWKPTGKVAAEMDDASSKQRSCLEAASLLGEDRGGDSGGKKKSGKAGIQSGLALRQGSILEFQDPAAEKQFRAWEASQNVTMDALLISCLLVIMLMMQTSAYISPTRPASAAQWGIIPLLSSCATGMYALCCLAISKSRYLRQREGIFLVLQAALHIVLLSNAFGARGQKMAGTGCLALAWVPFSQAGISYLFQVRMQNALKLQALVVAASLGVLTLMWRAGSLTLAQLVCPVVLELVLGFAFPRAVQYRNEFVRRSEFVVHLQHQFQLGQA